MVGGGRHVDMDVNSSRVGEEVQLGAAFPVSSRGGGGGGGRAALLRLIG